tara:strand:+ start:2978 stop:3172 length:195 start_codon:yes stop_codon:yes gene_type:complete
MNGGTWPGERPGRTIGFVVSAEMVDLIDAMRDTGETRSDILRQLVDESLAARRRRSFAARLWRR